MRKIILSHNAPAPIGPYSQAVAVGPTLYCSGQIPLDPATGTLSGETVETQTAQICKNIAAVLESAGHGFENVVKTTCYLTDMSDFAAFNAVYAKYFTSNPARACVAVKTLPAGALAEIEVISVK